MYNLLDQIWTPALKKAKEELADINAEIKKEGGDFEAEGWDWRYYADKARQAKFNMDENEVRPYLELNHVREGAFYVANKLYGITFTEIKDIPKPDPDALPESKSGQASYTHSSRSLPCSHPAQKRQSLHNPAVWPYPGGQLLVL